MIKPLPLGHSNFIKSKAMDAAQIRERLHLRIEQADERLLTVLAEMAESLFKTYQPEAGKQSRQESIAAYEASLKPMAQEELIARAQASNEDIEAGRIYSRREVEKALGL